MTTVAEPVHVRKAREMQVEIIRRMTPSQRLAQAERMNQAMRELLAAGFRDRHPEWSGGQVHSAVAERILRGATD
ncbi:MAG TPA: hypothetical protein VIK52_00560 [Opitutaceae bacterium]